MKYVVLEYASKRAVVGELPKEIMHKIIDAILDGTNEGKDANKVVEEYLTEKFNISADQISFIFGDNVEVEYVDD